MMLQRVGKVRRVILLRPETQEKPETLGQAGLQAQISTVVLQPDNLWVLVMQALVEHREVRVIPVNSVPVQVVLGHIIQLCANAVEAVVAVATTRAASRAPLIMIAFRAMLMLP